jgi:hypothetical protein
VGWSNENGLMSERVRVGSQFQISIMKEGLTLNGSLIPWVMI